MSQQTYFEVLSRGNCIALLSAASIVRLAYTTNGQTHVFPVNAVVHEGEVVVRTTYGGKLAAAAHGATMTVEADELDEITRTGWVVNVIGRARLIEDLDDLAVLELAPLHPWAPGDKEFLIGIGLDDVTGRRISPPVR
jgi:uncharacterized protein